MYQNSTENKFKFNANCCPAENKFTKKEILSKISQIFDPLGLLGPVITKAKLIMQRLWQI